MVIVEEFKNQILSFSYSKNAKRMDTSGYQRTTKRQRGQERTRNTVKRDESMISSSDFLLIVSRLLTYPYVCQCVCLSVCIHIYICMCFVQIQTRANCNEHGHKTRNKPNQTNSTRVDLILFRFIFSYFRTLLRSTKIRRWPRPAPTAISFQVLPRNTNMRRVAV